MLKEFEYPEIQIISYDVEDVITTSEDNNDMGWA